MMYEDRIARLQKAMRAAGVDYVFLSPSTDMRYLTGVNAHVSERLTCCIIGQGDATFVLPAFERDHITDAQRALAGVRGFQDGEDPFAPVREFMAGAQSVMVSRYVPAWTLLELQRMPHCRWELADALIAPMRAVKDAAEEAAIIDAHARSARALGRLVAHGLCGLSEAAATRILGDYFIDEGMKLSAGGVASGPNSAGAHHVPGERVIEAGDVVWIDFGGVVPDLGYQSDITRTFAIKRIPEGYTEIYGAVLAANEAAFQATRPGVRYEQIDFAGRRVIDAAGYGQYFTHRLGHGLGLDMHEPPYICVGNQELVQPGNVFSDEPGIYIPGKYGVRIEDILVIDGEGAKRITPFTCELMVID